MTPPRPTEGKHSPYCLALSANQCSCPTIVLKASDYEAVCALNANLIAALEYIELTGGNMGHVIDLKGAPCGCGGCMANEASKALLKEAKK